MIEMDYRRGKQQSQNIALAHNTIPSLLLPALFPTTTVSTDYRYKGVIIRAGGLGARGHMGFGGKGTLKDKTIAKERYQRN
ncbi:unnamed protein product [Arctogadus glacialis]